MGPFPLLDSGNSLFTLHLLQVSEKLQENETLPKGWDPNLDSYPGSKGAPQ